MPNKGVDGATILNGSMEKMAFSSQIRLLARCSDMCPQQQQHLLFKHHEFYR